MSTFNRRDFIFMSGALIACGPLFGKNIVRGEGRHVVFTAKLNGKLFFTKMDPITQTITKIPAVCGPHSYQEDNGIYYGVEKKGQNLVRIDFNNPKAMLKTMSPDGIIYYGHSIVHKNKLVVCGVKIASTKSIYDINQSDPNNSEGVLLVYDKNTLKLLEIKEGLGFGPHEIIKHDGQAVLATTKNPKNKLSALVWLDLDTLAVKKTQLIDEKHKHLKFRHFIANSDQLYPVLGCFNKKKQGTNVAVGRFDQKGELIITDFSNAKEPNSDYDHTTSFAHDDKLHVVLFHINKMLIMNKSSSFVDFGSSDLRQLRYITDVVMKGNNAFIFKDKEMNAEFLIKSHIYIS